VAQLVFDDLGHHVLLLHAGRLGDPRDVPVAAGQLGVGLHRHEMDEAPAVLVGHLLRRLDPLALLDPRHELGLSHGHLLSTTRTAFPSLRGSVLGGTTAPSGLRPRRPRRHSPTRAARACTSARAESNPPHPATRPSVGSTWTARVGNAWVRSTMSW